MSPKTYLQNNRQLVMIDAGLKNREILLEALASGIDVWPIAMGSDIQETLGTALLQGYEKIHFLGHGQSGVISLGGQLLDTDDFTRAISLAEGNKVKLPSLHFWACMTGAGNKGRIFVDNIAQACNTVVSAFTGLVGAQHLGGTWIPDVISQAGEMISVPFVSALSYPHTLQLSELDLRSVITQTGYDIQVWLKAGTVVDAIDLALNYDASKASYINAVSNPALAGWSWIPNEETSGHLLISGYSTSFTAINNANDILLETMSFSMKPGYNGFTAGLVSGTGLSNSDTSLPISILPNLDIVGNFTPTFTVFASTVGNGNEDSQIAISFADLQAQGNDADIDGTVSAFVIKAVSTGTLLIGTSAGTATAWNASTNNSIDLTHQAFWTPAANANGSLNAFTAVAKDDGGLESATAIQAKVAVTAVNDLPTGAVTITGTATQNQTLTATNSLADVDGLGTIAYQWLANGTAITGATASTLTLGQAQVGKTITVQAGYTDLLGASESVNSVATGAVVNINDAPTGTVTITGTATQNQTLTATNNLADVDGLGTIAYQWLANGTAIGGATASTLALGQAQVGKTITVKAAYTDQQNTAESVSSSATTSVVNVNDVPTGAVTITGTATQNQTLTATNSLADVDGLGTIAYQWLANGTAINGATASTLTLGQAQVGKAITVKAGYTDLLGAAESISSLATANVANVNDLPTGAVTITGTAIQNQTLTAANSLADVDGLGTIAYQWLANGTAISGAITSTLTLGQAQVGKTITVKAAYTDLQGTAESISSLATANVANVNDLPTGAVAITGTATQNQTLTAANSLADIDGLGTVSYQWLANGTAISGATTSTLTLGQAQVGKAITVQAAYTDLQGTAESVSSIATRAIVNVNDAPTLTAFASTVATGNEDSQIAVTFANLQTQGNEADIDGAVTDFVIKAVSTGSLKIGTSASAATAWNASSNATVDATHLAFWTPAANANGSLNAFTAVAKDNDGLVSATVIQVKVKVTAVNDAPVLIAPTAISFTDTIFDDAFATATGALVASDNDRNALTYGITGGIDNGQGGFTKTTTYGVLTVSKATGAYTFVPNDAAIEALKVKASTSFTVTASDGLLDNSKTLTITLAQQGTTESTGNDTLTGTVGNNKFDGLAGNDTISGLAGNDILNGGAGADKLIGGLGNDTYVVDNTGDVVTETSALVAEIDSVNSWITYTLTANVENLTLAGTAALNGTGNSLNNTLTGNVAANTLIGGAGNDTLTGGKGTDKLTGGAGTDRFDFNALIESVKGTARDSITDFTHSQADKIDLSGIDANSKVGRDQGFSYIGAKAFTGVAGQLDYLNGILAGDTNGDKVADFEIAITLVGGTPLVSTDFVL